MRDAESQAAWVVCPWCDEKKCVGRYNYSQIREHLNNQASKEKSHGSV